MKTQNELIEIIKQQLIRLYEDNWLVNLIDKALEKANSDIDKAITIAYDELGLDVWSGFSSPGGDAGEISLTGKTTGFIAYWSEENPDHFLGEPDIVLDNRQVFTLIRDKTLPTQEPLF